MIVFHGLACIFSLSFATTLATQNVNKFVVIVFIQFSPAMFIPFNIKKLAALKMWNLHMESRIKQDYSSKVKKIRTLSSDSILVFVLRVVCCKSSPLYLYITISISGGPNERNIKPGKSC